MDAPRVFLICVNKLVCEAVNVLLRREGMVLLGMETDPEAALSRVNALDPDIVVVEGLGGADSDELSLLPMMPSSPNARERKNRQDKAESNLMAALLGMAYKRQHLRIIQLCLPNEELRIYHQEQRRFSNTHDLVTAIQSAVGQVR